MEDNVFGLPEVKKEFEKFVKVHLYTDLDKFFELQQKLVNNSSLPGYVILKPGSEVVVDFMGYPGNPGTRAEEFRKFLEEGAAKAMAN